MWGSGKRQLLERVAREVRELFLYLTLRLPFLHPVFRRLRVVVVSVETLETLQRHPVLPGEHGLLIGAERFAQLSLGQKLFTLLHEALHVALRHVDKCRRREHPDLFNIAADIVVNELIRAAAAGHHPEIEMPQGALTAEDAEKLTGGLITAERARRASAEEIYYALLRALSTGRLRPCQCSDDDLVAATTTDWESRLGINDRAPAVTVQESGNSTGQDYVTVEPLDRSGFDPAQIASEIEAMQAVMPSPGIGTMPGSIQVLVDQLRRAR